MITLVSFLITLVSLATSLSAMFFSSLAVKLCKGIQKIGNPKNPCGHGQENSSLGHSQRIGITSDVVKVVCK